MISIRRSLHVGTAVAIFLPQIAGAQKPQAVVLNAIPVVVSPAGPGLDSVRAILERDFDYSDRLDPIVLDQRTRASTLAPDGFPNFNQLVKLKARAVVVPRVEGNGIRVTYYDVHASHLVQQAFFPLAEMPDRDSATPLSASRDSALRDSLAYINRLSIHAISDEVTRWITGQKGYAQSRLVYVSNGMLRIVDSDGANDRALTTSGLALSPQWHPDGNKVVFSHFTRAGTQIAQVDVWTGQISMVGATPRGLNITPTYTPDGRRIIYSSAGNSSTGLVVADADSSAPARQLSFTTQETSSPTFGPDGRLAYIAPKPWQGTGANARMTPQIYIMNPDGTGEIQLTPTVPGVRSYRTSPDWAPDGSKVAYMQQQGDFQLWTIDVKSRKMRQLTVAGSENEDPTWSPDSRHLAFTSNRSGAKEIWVLDTQTGRTRQLTRRGGGARLAAWSKPYDPMMFARRGIGTTATVSAVIQQR